MRSYLFIYLFIYIAGTPHTEPHPWRAAGLTEQIKWRPRPPPPPNLVTSTAAPPLPARGRASHGRSAVPCPGVRDSRAGGARERPRPPIPARAAVLGAEGCSDRGAGAGPGRTPCLLPCPGGVRVARGRERCAVPSVRSELRCEAGQERREQFAVPGEAGRQPGCSSRLCAGQEPGASQRTELAKRETPGMCAQVLLF